MVTTFRLKALMGAEQTIKFDNGIVLMKTEFNAVLVGKVKDFDLLWIENYENLPEKGKALILKMMRARKTMLSFDTEFNVVTKGIVLDDLKKPAK